MLRAVIFDVDGVLVDSYRAHFLSWRRLALEHALSITEEQFAGTFGRTSRDIIRRFWTDAHLTEERVHELDDRKEAFYRSIVSSDFPAMDGASELLETLRAAGVRLAVGSSAPPENVDLVLDRLGARDKVSAVVTGRDVTHGKPDPEVFLCAAHRLAVEPECCAVVEDAPAGIRAAKRAGMTAVALVSTGRAPEDFEGLDVDLVVDSLRELSPHILAALVR